MNVRERLASALASTRKGLWPSQAPPAPRPDGTPELLEAAALAQLDHTIAALPRWDGARDASAWSTCTYGHTHLTIRIVRTDELASPADQRLMLARKAMREILKPYIARGTPGDGFEQHRACGDSEITISVQWIV